ncbi:MAG: hypothetical protein ACNI25_03435 [Halarcobacter sp.]
MLVNKKIVLQGFIVVFVVIFQGCAYSGNQIVEDSVGANRDSVLGKYESGVGTLAVTSDRRMVVVNMKNSEFCAEPEPLTASSFTSKLEALLDATVKDDVDAKVEFMREYNTVISQLFKSSQGLRFAQILQYNLCQAARNKDIDDKTSFEDIFKYISRLSKDIIIAENNVEKVNQTITISKQKELSSKLEKEIKTKDESIKTLKESNKTLQTEVKNLKEEKMVHEKEIEYLKKMVEKK